MTQNSSGIELIYKISRVLGLFPLNESYQLTSHNLLYSLLFLTIHLIALVHESDTKDPRWNSIFGQTFVWVHITLESILRVLSIAWPILRKNDFQAAMKSLSSLERKEGCRWFSSKYFTYLKASAVIMVLLPYFFAFGVYSLEMGTSYATRDVLVFLISNLSIICFLCQYVLIFNFLSFMYENIASYCYNETALVWSEKVLETAEMVQEIYHPYILTTFAWCFTLVLMHMYAIFLPVFTSGPVVTVFAMWLFIFFLDIYFMLQPAVRISGEAKKFNEVLYWKMVEDKTGFLQNNEKLNFHFTAKRELCFTACGFFKLNNSLICTMIATATTYLVISLQYGKSGLSPTDYQQLDNRNGSYGNGS